MVVVTNVALPAMEKAKKKTMVVYAQKVLNAANTKFFSDNMISGSTKERYTVKELMGNDDVYTGIVVVKSINGLNTYSLNLFDENYKIYVDEITSTTLSTDTTNDIKEHNESFDSLQGTYDGVDALGNKDIEKAPIYGKNLLDGISIKDGDYYVSKNFGSFIESPNWISTETFIPVVAGASYKFDVIGPKDGTREAGLAWFGDDKKQLVADGKKIGLNYDDFKDKDFEFTSPPNAKYMLISWRGDLNPDWENTVSLRQNINWSES